MKPISCSCDKDDTSGLAYGLCIVTYNPKRKTYTQTQNLNPKPKPKPKPKT